MNGQKKLAVAGDIFCRVPEQEASARWQKKSWIMPPRIGFARPSIQDQSLKQKTPATFSSREFVLFAG